jgi:hypothetical protein
MAASTLSRLRADVGHQPGAVGVVVGRDDVGVELGEAARNAAAC